MSQSFSQKDPAEVIVLSFDFTALVEAGETVSSCTFSSTDRQKNKNATSDMVVGSADISGAPIVKQKIEGGVDGHNYLIRAVLNLSSGRILVGSAVLPVVNGGA